MESDRGMSRHRVSSTKIDSRSASRSPGLRQQFLFRDDGIVDGESGGIEQSVKPACVEIIYEDVGIYEDRILPCFNLVQECIVGLFRPCFRSAVT